MSIRARSEDVQEGNWVTFDLTRTGSTDSSLEATVKLTKWNWNARANETVTAVFEAGSATAIWSRQTEDEELNNGDTLYVAVVSGTATTYYVGLDGHPRRATVLVRDNDLPLVWLEPEMGEHIEQDGCPDSTFTLHRSMVIRQMSLQVMLSRAEICLVLSGAGRRHQSLDIGLGHPLKGSPVPAWRVLRLSMSTRVPIASWSPGRRVSPDAFWPLTG